MKIDKKTIIAVVLVAVALVVVIYRLKGVVPSPTSMITSTISSEPKGQGTTASQSQVSTTVAAAPRNEYETYMANVTESDLAYGSKDFRNPMEPLVSALAGI